MSFDATFWVAISFFIFIGLLVYFKIPQNINNLLTKMIGDIKKEIDEYEKIILDSKIKAKNYFNEAREKILEDINKKRNALEKDLDEEISSVENELSEFRNKSGEKINKIAAETSAELIKELIGEEVNSSSIAAIVEDQAKLNKERKDVV